MKRLMSLLLLLSSLAGAETLDLSLSRYGEFSSDPAVNRSMAQTAFRRISCDLAGATAMPLLSAASPLEWKKVDAGVSISGTGIVRGEKHMSLSATGSNMQPWMIVAPRIHIQVGLPDRFDAGIVIGTLPQLKRGKGILAGAEIRYAILAGSAISSAIGVRAHYTGLIGADDISLGTEGLEVYISKSFVVFTPYAGAGLLCSQASSKAAPFSFGGGVQKVKDEPFLFEPRGTAGLKIAHMQELNTVLEIDAVKPNSIILPTYRLKVLASF